MVDAFSVEEFSTWKKERMEGEAESDGNNNGPAIKQEKYSLRPRSMRQKTEKGLELKSEILNVRNRRNPQGGKFKQKPPPLSKYRRKTANARERNRMREINVAFETLRRAVPQISGSLTSRNEKLTKITTLRLATKYIQALRQVLDGDSSGNSGGGSSHHQIPVSLCSAAFLEEEADFVDVLLSDGESLQFNSDASESFASPDRPLTSPFSEFSNDGESPEAAAILDFRFGGNLTDAEFGEDFLVDGLSITGLS